MQASFTPYKENFITTNDI